MKSAFLQDVMKQRAEIARHWRHVLRETPVHTALANPDTLAFMIEPTLTGLFQRALQNPGPSWKPQAPPAVKLVDAVSRCALNPMIGYYLAGEAAITRVARRMNPHGDLTESDILAAESELLALLREIGRSEVTSFCEICLIETPVSASAKASHTMPATCPFKAGQRGGSGSETL
jgi:hypothetical protein